MTTLAFSKAKAGKCYRISRGDTRTTCSSAEKEAARPFTGHRAKLRGTEAHKAEAPERVAKEHVLKGNRSKLQWQGKSMRNLLMLTQISKAVSKGHDCKKH